MSRPLIDLSIMTKRVLIATLAIVAILPLAGCPSTNDAPGKDGKDASAAAKVVSMDAGADAEADDEVRPVYDVSPSDPPEPHALRLCKALSEVQEEKRAACCKIAPRMVLTDECSRMLGAAIRAKAVTLADADIDACISGLQKRYDGCDWVGPFPPGPPAECTALVKGTLADGARCRSSLECAGTSHCAGLTPTRAGKCAPPAPDGASCGGTVDPLVGFARQTTEQSHPDCQSRCIEHKCGAPKKDGATCAITAECEDGSQCIAKKCAKAAPAKVGQACPGGLCEAPAECIQGTCSVKKAAGETCAADFECKGGCLKSDAGKGACGPRCDIR